MQSSPERVTVERIAVSPSGEAAHSQKEGEL